MKKTQGQLGPAFLCALIDFSHFYLVLSSHFWSFMYWRLSWFKVPSSGEFVIIFGDFIGKNKKRGRSLIKDSEPGYWKKKKREKNDRTKNWLIFSSAKCQCFLNNWRINVTQEIGQFANFLGDFFSSNTKPCVFFAQNLFFLSFRPSFFSRSILAKWAYLQIC